MSIIGNVPLSLMLMAFALSASGVMDSSGIQVEQRFRRLRKGSLTLPVETHAINFRTHHPQGMTAVGDRFFLSSVEVIDRTSEKGTGHLFEMDRNGMLLREIQLGEGALYHPGKYRGNTGTDYAIN